MSELERRLRGWRLQLLRSIWAEGSVRFAVLAAGILLAALLADRLIGVPLAWRWGVFWTGAAALGAGLYAYLLRPLGRLGSARLLAAVAENRPELKAYIESAWELGRTGPARGTSRALVDEHLARTEGRLRGLSRRPVFSWRPSRRASRRLFAAAAAWGIGTPWLFDGHARFQRVLAPWRDVSLESLVEVSPGDASVVWGKPVEIGARWRGSASGPLSLWARTPDAGGGGRWERVPWDRPGPAEFSFGIESLTSVFEYRLGSEDTRSRVYALRPLPLPRLIELSARVRLPGSGPEVKEVPLEGGGEIASLRGSWVTLRGRPVEPLEEAALSVSFLSNPIPMKKAGDGFWEAGFPLNENGTLKIELASAAGVRDPEPVAHAVRVLEDEFPRVELLSPAFELEISPAETLPVTYEAGDDFGLTSLALIFRVDGGPVSVVPLRRFREKPVRFLGDHAWDLARFPLGSRVEFRIRATDDARPDSQTAVSEKGVLHIVDFEAVHRLTEGKWLGAEAAIRRLALGEAEAAKLLEAIAKSDASGQVPKLAELREAGPRLDRAWKDALEALSSLSQSMKEDPYANPGMTESAEALESALSSMSRSELPSARESAKKGDWSEAARKHAELGKRVSRAAEILSAGKEMQAMQDFWGEAQRMDQAGAEISGALGKIAGSGKAPTAEEKRKLDEALANLRRQMGELAKAIQSLPQAEEGSPAERRRKVYRVPLNAAQRTMSALEDALARGDYAAAAKIAEQLSRDLAAVHEAIAGAARNYATGESESPGARFEELAAMWKDAVKAQAESLRSVNEVEDEKINQRLMAQQKLLRELAALQKEVVSDSDAGKTPLKPGLVPADAVAVMRRVLAEFESEKVQEAPALLSAVIQRVVGQAAALEAGKLASAEEVEALRGVATRELNILDALKKGAPQAPVSEEQLSRIFAASAVQRQAGKKAAAIEGKLDELSYDFGLEPGEAMDSVRAARAEQARAEEALRNRDTAAARGHEENALGHLSKGQESLQQSVRRQQGISQGAARPFGRPRGIGRPVGGGGRTGADTGFVPLPDAEEYQPPRRIRREVEKSLRERRPAVFDDAVNDYFKRMSQ